MTKKASITRVQKQSLSGVIKQMDYWIQHETPLILGINISLVPQYCSGAWLHSKSVTQSASTCAPVPGAALLSVSRGIAEAEYRGEEFGLERVRETFQKADLLSAQELYVTILEAAQQFMVAPPSHNDVTTLALLRDV